MRVWAWVLVLTFMPTPASAHQKSVSYSKWAPLDDGATAQVKVSWFDLTSLPEAQALDNGKPDSSVFLPYLERHLTLHTSSGACAPVDGSAEILPSERGWLRVEWRVRCEGAPTTLRSELFASLTNHVHLASIRGPGGIDVVLSSTSPTASVVPSGEGESSAGLFGFVRLGIEHILSGWDHIAFLLLLIVIAPRLREVVLLVTGFTVGHSVTLAAAALGAIVPNPRAVEAIIAASIVVVALENTKMESTGRGRVVVGVTLLLFACSAWLGQIPAFWGLALFTLCYFALLRTHRGHGRLRWLIACLFGFVHGLGFSSVLLAQELTRSQLVEALFGFNVGVELGQLALVALIWPILQWLRQREFGRPVVEWTSAVGAAAGTFALVVRVFGP
ncbi:MAG: HupE/UreJ family protein [Polyangiales bacterium]